MSSPIEILRAEKRTFKLPDETVDVCEMDWLSILAFIDKLAAAAGQFLTVSKDASGATVTSVNTSDLTKLITGSRELIHELVLKSTGKDEAWLGKQSPRAVLAMLDAAIDINLSEEFKKLGKDVGLRVAKGLGFVKTPSAQTLPT